MQPGNRLGDVSAAIQRAVEIEGLSIIRTLVGHGIGREMHEDPQVPNFGTPGKGPLLEEGTVLAIEPMVNAGGPAGADGRGRLGGLLPGRLARRARRSTVDARRARRRFDDGGRRMPASHRRRNTRKSGGPFRARGDRRCAGRPGHVVPRRAARRDRPHALDRAKPRKPRAAMQMTMQHDPRQHAHARRSPSNHGRPARCASDPQRRVQRESGPHADSRDRAKRTAKHACEGTRHLAPAAPQPREERTVAQQRTRRA